MGDFIYNMNYEERDKLLGISGEWEVGSGFKSVRKFDFINIGILKQLVDDRFIDPDESHNSSPSIEKIFNFMTKYPRVLAKGYATSPLRRDYRVSLDTLFVPKSHVTMTLKQDFVEFCTRPNEFEMKGNLYAWWD
ncbi:hypothetical protein [Paenibacillus planticolens]|uniref:Uncharacterized protein n=1 Tax=Paenibacillus planticolens TaxID=2654976 RepID=A0ABX1ZGU1_9BACL|nr:hypothetical protein [Paenibacillus planticolens]NOU99319.1 hypothetical protein [Paenibacillus planticolens]